MCVHPPPDKYGNKPLSVKKGGYAGLHVDFGDDTRVILEIIGRFGYKVIPLNP